MTNLLIKSSNSISFLVFIFTTLISQVYIFNYYSITASPDFRKYYDYFLYFNGDLQLTGIEQGLFYYFFCFLIFSKNSSNINIFNFEDVLSASILEANFYFYILTILGLIKLLKLFGQEYKNIFFVLSVLNFFPPMAVLRMVYKPEVVITTLFVWLIFFIETSLKLRSKFSPYLVVVTLAIITSIKVSSSIIVVLSILFIYKKRIFDLPKIYFLTSTFLVLYIFLGLENYAANGLLIFQHQNPSAYNNTAGFSFIYNFDVLKLISAPVRHEHSNSAISILLLDTFDDYFRLYWKNDESMFNAYSVKIYHNYFRQYLGILLSSVYFISIIFFINKKNKFRHFMALPFLGIFVMLFVSLFIQFDPSRGDMIKNYYFGFLLIISFCFILINVNKTIYQISFLILFTSLIFLIFGFPKTLNNSASQKIDYQNQYSITCGIGSYFDENVDSDCYDYESQYCSQEFLSEKKLDFVNGILTQIDSELYKQNIVNVYNLQLSNYSDSMESCFSKDLISRNKKFSLKNNFPIFNTLLFIIFLVGTAFRFKKR